MTSFKTLSLIAFGLGLTVQAHATDVCDRSKAAQLAIEVAVEKFDFKCDHVSEKDLKAIKDLRLDFEMKDGLRSGDFDDLPNLESISINCPGFGYEGPGISLPSGIFDGLGNLTNLNLFGCKFTSLPDYIYRKLPKLKSFDFEANGLDSLPAGLFEGSSETVVSLYLKSPSVLNARAFEGSHIQKLTLNFDDGGDFKAKYFKGLDQLTTLEIDTGSKTPSKLGKKAFQALVNLKNLKFQYGIFTEIDSEAFEGLDKLENLDFDTTYKAALPDLTFANMPALKTMNLQLIGVTEISENAFQGLPNLQAFKLYTSAFGPQLQLQSSLENLPAGLFRGMNSLASIDLSSNCFTSLSGRLFKDLPSLTTIKLDGNNLTNLDDQLFSGLPSLSDVNLSGNRFDAGTMVRLDKETPNTIYFGHQQGDL